MSNLTLFSGIKLSPSYNDCIHFNPDNPNQERDDMFSEPRMSFENVNFVFNKDDLQSNVVVKVEEGQEEQDILSCNYLKATFDSTSPIKEGYYFITEIEIISKFVYRLYLELDVMTTYPFGSMVTTKDDIFVERNHCSRFYKSTDSNGDEKLIFASNKEVLNSDDIDGNYKAPLIKDKIELKQNQNPFDEQNRVDTRATRQDIYREIEKYEWELIVMKAPLPNEKSPSGNEGVEDITQVEIYNTVEGKAIRFNGGNGTFKQVDNEQIEINNTDSGFYVYIAPVINTQKDVVYGLDNFPLIGYTDDSGKSHVTIWSFPSQEDIGDLCLNRYKIPINILYSLISSCARYREVETPIVPSSIKVGIYSKKSFRVFFDFSKTNSDTLYYPKIGVRRFSHIPPLQDISIYDSAKDYVNGANFLTRGLYASVCLRKWEIDNKIYEYSETLPILKTTEKRFIDLSKKNIDLEPKLYAPPFSRHELVSIITSSERYEFNPLVLRSDVAKAIFKFSPSSSTSRFSLFIEPHHFVVESQEVIDYYENSPYNKTYDALVGAFVTTDYSLPIYSSAYEEFMRTRKNFAISNLAVPISSSLGVSAGTLLATKMGGGNMLASMAGASIGIASALTSMLNYSTKIDDLKNSPNSIKNSGNDAIADLSYGLSLNPFILRYEMTPTEKKQVYNYFYRYGYKVNDYRKIDKLFCRSIFNYVKISDNLYDKLEIGVSRFDDVLRNRFIPHIVLMKINSILQKGVTFWEYGNYMFTHDRENFEKDDFILDISQADMLE